MTEYVRPSYADLLARIDTDLTAMPAVLREGLVKALARGTHGLHAALEWIDAQGSPLTCEEERLYDWASLYNVERLAATYASGVVLATGTAGAQLLARRQVRSATNGLDYTVTAAVILGAGNTAVSVRCNTAGAAGNLAAAGLLTLIDPVVGVSGTLTIDDDGLTGGEEIEALESFRSRVADEWQTMVSEGARSGKPGDYRYWARSAHPSVTTALVQPHVLGLGTVLVRPICNGLPDRQPSQAVLDAVAAYMAEVAPAKADTRFAAGIVRLVNFSLDLAAGYDTEANRTAITSALNATILGKQSEGATLTTGEVDAAVSTVTQAYTRLAPLADITAAAGEVLVFGAINWL